jgi:hypothetical protein
MDFSLVFMFNIPIVVHRNLYQGLEEGSPCHEKIQSCILHIAYSMYHTTMESPRWNHPTQWTPLHLKHSIIHYSIELDAHLKFLVRSKRGPIMLKSGSSWNLVSLSASSTKGGWEGHAESSGIRPRRGIKYLVTRSYIQNQTTSWSVHIRNTLDVGTSHRQPWTHLTHHGPDSGEATTFPYIVFFVSFCRTCIRMAFFPRTPKVESRNCPGLDSRDFGCS